MKAHSKSKLQLVIFSFFLLIISTCSVSAQSNSQLLGKWTLTKERNQLYDGDKLINSGPFEESGDIQLNFKSNKKVDFIGDMGKIINYNYKIKGKQVTFTSINGDSEDMNFLNFKIIGKTLHLFLEVIDDPESEHLANPNLRHEYVFVR